jgi:2-oxoglutarate ferredoxin oxidoreductase subunit alpha
MYSKINDNLDDILLYEEIDLDDAEIALVAYGGTAMAAVHAVSLAREQGIKLGLLKLQTIWPFPEERMKKLARDVGTIIVPELNFGQVRSEVERLSAGQSVIEGINKADGNQITPEEILAVVRRQQVSVS